jgi:hypothetical protein
MAFNCSHLELWNQGVSLYIPITGDGRDNTLCLIVCLGASFASSTARSLDWWLPNFKIKFERHKKCIYMYIYIYIYIYIYACVRPSLWSTSQSYWLQIQRYGFDSRSYKIFWGIVGLECDKLSLVSTIGKLLWRNSSGSGLESRKYDRRYPLLWQHNIL